MAVVVSPNRLVRRVGQHYSVRAKRKNPPDKKIMLGSRNKSAVLAHTSETPQTRRLIAPPLLSFTHAQSETTTTSLGNEFYPPPVDGESHNARRYHCVSIEVRATSMCSLFWLEIYDSCSYNFCPLSVKRVHQQGNPAEPVSQGSAQFFLLFQGPVVISHLRRYAMPSGSTT